MCIRDSRETALPPQDIPLDVVYEDDDVIVVNKPTGLVGQGRLAELGDVHGDRLTAGEAGAFGGGLAVDTDAALGDQEMCIRDSPT